MISWKMPSGMAIRKDVFTLTKMVSLCFFFRRISDFVRRESQVSFIVYDLAVLLQ